MVIENLKSLAVDRTVSILGEVGVKYRKRTFNTEDIIVFQIPSFGTLGICCIIYFDNSVISNNLKNSLGKLKRYNNIKMLTYGIRFDYIIKELDTDRYDVIDYMGKSLIYEGRMSNLKKLPDQLVDGYKLNAPYYVLKDLNEGSTSFWNDIIIDCFAGGGGASLGIEMAFGRSVNIAINHNPNAIAMHELNHPDTLHLTEDILKVNLRKYLKLGQRVRFMWASPDCTSHSRAKGDKPIEKGLRILPMSVYRLCKQILEVTGRLPEVIMMENVVELQDWGPLDENNKPIKERKGEYYQKFINLMISLGYRFECRELVAADFGAPTTRKRWYAQFRSDDKPISWPVPTHNKKGTNGLKKWEQIADYINFNDLGKSIFGRKKPLADKTMKRIAMGMDKFVLNCNEPFIVQVNHGGDNFRGQNIHDPIPTITQKHGYGVATPYIMQIGQTGFSKKRNRSVLKPMSTVVTKNEHCLASPMIIQYHSETTKNKVRGQSVQEPIMTIDTSPRYALVSAFLTKFYKSGRGQSLLEPIHTITTSAGHFGQISILAVDYKQLIANGVNTETAQKCTWVSQFIMEYYGCGTGQSLKDPLHTIVTKDRFALITMLGNEYAILDIFLRMLEPEELKLGQGFKKDYIIDFLMPNGKPYPKSEQVARIGNSVVPIMAEKLAMAACPYLKIGERVPNLMIGDVRQQLKYA